MRVLAYPFWFPLTTRAHRYEVGRAISMLDKRRVDCHRVAVSCFASASTLYGVQNPKVNNTQVILCSPHQIFFRFLLSASIVQFCLCMAQTACFVAYLLTAFIHSLQLRRRSREVFSSYQQLLSTMLLYIVYTLNVSQLIPFAHCSANCRCLVRPLVRYRRTFIGSRDFFLHTA